MPIATGKIGDFQFVRYEMNRKLHLVSSLNLLGPCITARPRKKWLQRLHKAEHLQKCPWQLCAVGESVE